MSRTNASMAAMRLCSRRADRSAFALDPIHSLKLLGRVEFPQGLAIAGGNGAENAVHAAAFEDALGDQDNVRGRGNDAFIGHGPHSVERTDGVDAARQMDHFVDARVGAGDRASGRVRAQAAE